MKTLRKIKVPTGDILIVEGERRKPLELLSIGDYGKEKNVKADFLGFTKPINGVPHGDLMPLEHKWVVTISSQYGCSMGCRFCDVPKVGPGLNASHSDMVGQVMAGIALHPEVKRTNRLNVHLARMGEPTWNPFVFSAVEEIRRRIDGWGFHPVLSTMMPRGNTWLACHIHRWLDLKRAYAGDAGLQVSVNTTDEEIRERDFAGSALPLCAISDLFESIFTLGAHVVGRKIALNFALTSAPVDADYLARLFNPELFMCKLTPMHRTDACEANGLFGPDGYSAFYPYQQVEDDLKRAGFDVIVFIPSREEDESRITCGNAILSGTEPRMQ